MRLKWTSPPKPTHQRQQKFTKPFFSPSPDCATPVRRPHSLVRASSPAPCPTPTPHPTHSRSPPRLPRSLHAPTSRSPPLLQLSQQIAAAAMRTALALFVLALLAFAAHAQRQDQALDSLMLSDNLQPVNDPIPRLLAEALAEAGPTPGSYGKTPIPTAVAPVTTPAPAKSSSSGAAASVVSLMAAAAAAVVLL